MIILFNKPVKRMLSIAFVLLSGCKDTAKNSSLMFEELNENLERSNKVIENNTKGILFNLENKTHEPETAEVAAVWFPVADSIYSKGKYLVTFIDGLKSNLKLNKIEMGARNSSDLYQKLVSYEDFILKSNSHLKSAGKNSVEILNTGVKNRNEFYKINFLDKEIVQITTALLKIENNILIKTNNIVAFCNNQATTFHCGILGKFQPIAVINSTKFGSGEELVVNAGVGEFKLTGNPSFEINGVNIQPNENGVGEYKMKIKSKPGNYKIHIKIKYTTPGGRQDAIEKDIEYKVVE